MSLTLACTACRHHDWRRELLEEWAELVDRSTACTAMAETTACAGSIGPRLQRRFGVFDQRARPRARCRRSREPFIAQVGAILDAMPDDMRNELHTITAPTLVITGSQDTPHAARRRRGAGRADLRRRASTCCSGAAHGLMAEAPNAFNDAVLRFLDEVDEAARRRGSEAAHETA